MALTDTPPMFPRVSAPSLSDAMWEYRHKAWVERGQRWYSREDVDAECLALEGLGLNLGNLAKQAAKVLDMPASDALALMLDGLDPDLHQRAVIEAAARGEASQSMQEAA